MKVLGAHIRIHDGRYVAGFAVVQHDQLLAQQSYPAPADETEAGRLGELYSRVGDLITRTTPDVFALKASEIARQTANAVTAQRAEGVLLGAVGRNRTLPVSIWSGRKLWKPAGLSASAKTRESVDSLCSRLTPQPDTDEARQAAAAAVAALAAA
jgi:Holliday junction resolvasome RuvABC endonuclease subunit